MKALEIRYSSEKGMIKFYHTSWEHNLGESVLSEVDGKTMNMFVISREDNITEEGYKFFLNLYNNHKGSLSRNLPNLAEGRMRLALHILTQVSKLSEAEQVAAFEAYKNKLEAERAKRDEAYAKRAERVINYLLQTI